MRHGFAKILLPVEYPVVVDVNQPFDIQYTIKNIGEVTDTLTAYMTADGQELPNSRWKKRMTVNSTVTKTYHHPGLTKSTQILLQAGY